MDFLKLAENRYSSRSFDTAREIEDEKLQAIFRAVQLAPTGRNAQQFKVLVLQSEKARRMAAQCTICTYGAPVVLLFVYDSMHPESSLEDNDVNVGLVNSTIAATYAMNEAEEQGLGSCYVELFLADRTKTLFKLPLGWEPACFMPIGYSTAEPGPRHSVRKAIEEIVEYI